MSDGDTEAAAPGDLPARPAPEPPKEQLRRRLGRGTSFDDGIATGDDESESEAASESAAGGPVDGVGAVSATAAENQPTGPVEEPVAEAPENVDAGLPDPRRYAARRWAELNDPRAPFFVRSDGVGVRMRLKELLDACQSRTDGIMRADRVASLRDETRETLWGPEEFLRPRHTGVAKYLGPALRAGDESRVLPTGGVDHLTVDAALKELDAGRLKAALIDEIAHRADEAVNVKGLVRIDAPLALLDAELAYDGHSPHWRRGVAMAVDGLLRADPGLTLSAAISDTLRESRDGWPRTVRLIIPVDVTQTQTEEAFRGPETAADLIERLKVAGVRVPKGLEAHMGSHAYDKQVEDASDLDAALLRASEWIEQEASVYRLQGGQLQTLGHWMLLVDGEDGAELADVARPAPLRLLPDDVGDLREMLTTEPSKIATSDADAKMVGAFMQLAQVPASVPGAAVSDLWQVMESVFTGVESDKGTVSAEVLTDALVYEYPLEVLRWIGRRLADIGVEAKAGMPLAASTLRHFETEPGRIFNLIAAADDPLLYVRASQFGAWKPKAEPSHVLTEAVAKVRRDAERIADRAYLIRNFRVHRGQAERATALAVTTPPFAEMVRVGLGHVARTAERRKAPIVAARRAGMRMEQLLQNFEGTSAPGAPELRETLRDDMAPPPTTGSG